MERNIKQDYDSLIETCKTNLQIELRQFKKEKLKIKQNTYKKITTEHLVKYIIDKGNLFSIPHSPCIWKFVKFSKLFLNQITSFDYDKLINIFIPILLGNFSNIERPSIEKEKICCKSPCIYEC